MNHKDHEISVIHRLAINKDFVIGNDDPLTYKNYFLKELSEVFNKEDKLCYLNLQFFYSTKSDNESFQFSRLHDIPTIYALPQNHDYSIEKSNLDLLAFLTFCSLVDKNPFGGVYAALKNFKDKFIVEIIKDKAINNDSDVVKLKEQQKTLTLYIPDLYDSNISDNLFEEFKNVYQKDDIDCFNDRACLIQGEKIEKQMQKIFSSDKHEEIGHAANNFFSREDVKVLLNKYVPLLSTVLQKAGIQIEQFNVLQFMKIALIHSWVKDVKCSYQIALSRQKPSGDVYGVMLVTSNRELEPSKLNLLHIALNIAVNNLNEIISLNKSRSRSLKLQNQEIETPAFLYEDPGFIYADASMKKINIEIERFAMLDYPVLLMGETGVGKDVIAREIHKRSKRSSHPFVSIPVRNLSAQIIESELFGYEKGAFTGADEKRIGKLEGANGGTIYLPEISDLTESLQHKLMEFIQYQTISRVGAGGGKKIKLDVRLIFAATPVIKKLVEEGKIREDFYYRINVLSLNIPPLRERKSDILPLALHFLKMNAMNLTGRMTGLSDEATEYLINNEWRGNVRELEYAILRAIIKCETDEILPIHFQEANKIKGVNATEKCSSDNYKEAERNFKIEYFRKLLTQNNGNISKAAKLAGISRQTLHKILKELGLLEKL